MRLPERDQTRHIVRESIAEIRDENVGGQRERGPHVLGRSDDIQQNLVELVGRYLRLGTLRAHAASQKVAQLAVIRERTFSAGIRHCESELPL
jgi:hypothetical protein